MTLLYSLHDVLRYLPAAVLLLVGAGLHAYAPYYHAGVLNRLQQHRITGTRAERLDAYFRWSTRVPALLGVALLTFVWCRRP